MVSRSTTLVRVLLVAAIAAVLIPTPVAATGQAVHGRRSQPAQAPDDLGRRLCDALESAPETRKAQCCGTSPAPGLAVACAQEVSRSLRERTATLEPADVDRCAAESAQALEGCDWVTPYAPRVPPSCRGILHGRLEAGVRCRSSIECREGLHCLGSGPTTPGVCAPPGVPGTSCGGVPDALTTYARQPGDDTHHPECAGFCLRGRCAASIPTGRECASDRQCAPGSHCAARRCVEGPSPTLGEPCADATCAGDLVCVDGRCAQPKKTGERCTQAFECQATCLSPKADQPGTCGMKCSAWPPAGYTPPVDGSLAHATSSRPQQPPSDRRPSE